MAILSRILSNDKINGRVTPPGAAPLIHRYMICGALAGAKIPSVEEYDPGDIRVTKKCLETLSLGNRSVSDENFTYRLECGDSDSTYKFLLPIASACGKNCIYGLRGNLVFTSMDQFFKEIGRAHV